MNAENAETKAPVDRLVMPVSSSDDTLVSALRILSVEIESADGVANAAIAEAATRMEQLIKVDNKLQAALHLAKGSYGTAKDHALIVELSDPHMSHELKHLAANFLRIAELIEESGFQSA